MDKKCEIGLYHVKLDRVTYNRNFFAKKVKNTQTYRTALLKNSFNWHVTPNLFLNPAWKKKSFYADRMYAVCDFLPSCAKRDNPARFTIE